MKTKSNPLMSGISVPVYNVMLHGMGMGDGGILIIICCMAFKINIWNIIHLPSPLALTSPLLAVTALLMCITLLPSYALYTIMPHRPPPAVGSAERSGPLI